MSIEVVQLKRIGSTSPGPDDRCLSIGHQGDKDDAKSNLRVRLLLNRKEWHQIVTTHKDIPPPLKGKILRWYNNRSTEDSDVTKRIALHRDNESHAIEVRLQAGKFKAKKA